MASPSPGSWELSALDPRAPQLVPRRGLEEPVDNRDQMQTQ